MKETGGEDVTPRLMQAGKAIAAHGPEASDAELVAACIQADADAFALLLQRHQQMVRRVAWRMGLRNADVDDVAQETFLKLWNNPGQIREAAALKGWLVRVASNLVMDRFRKKPMDDLDAAEDVSDGAPGADEMMERNWAAGEVDLAMAISHGRTTGATAGRRPPRFTSGRSISPRRHSASTRKTSTPGSASPTTTPNSAIVGRPSSK